MQIPTRLFSKSFFISNLLFLGVLSFYATPVSATVVINEFMASNDSSLTDEDGAHSDWIELYNNGSASVNLSNWSITDDQK